MKKLIIVVGMKYSAELSCAIEMLVEKPSMLKIPTKLTLKALQVDGTLASTATAPTEYSLMICIMNRSRHMQTSWINLIKIV